MIPKIAGFPQKIRKHPQWPAARDTTHFDDHPVIERMKVDLQKRAEKKCERLDTLQVLLPGKWPESRDGAPSPT